jgi:ferredoxin
MSLKVRINPIACDAHGLCVEMLPELMRIDDWGYPIIDTSEIPPELEALAQRAASLCPTLAIVIEEVPSGV